MIFFRAIGWLISELIPAQICGRDYERAVAELDEVDDLESGELRQRFYCNRCGGGYYRPAHACGRGDT